MACLSKAGGLFPFPTIISMVEQQANAIKAMFTVTFHSAKRMCEYFFQDPSPV